MSLLMDALRKAEESKKKVAQSQKSDAAETKQATGETEKKTVDESSASSSEAGRAAETTVPAKASGPRSTPQLTIDSIDPEDSSAASIIAETEEKVASRASSLSDLAAKYGKRSKQQDSPSHKIPELEFEAAPGEHARLDSSDLKDLSPIEESGQTKLHTDMEAGPEDAGTDQAKTDEAGALNIGQTPEQPAIDYVAYQTRAEEKAQEKPEGKQQQAEQKQGSAQAQQGKRSELKLQEREGLQGQEPQQRREPAELQIHQPEGLQGRKPARQQQRESDELQIQAKEEPKPQDQGKKDKAARKQDDRNLAKAVFTAKRPGPSRARYLQLFGLGTGAVLLAGLAAYFYFLPGVGIEFTLPIANNLAVGPASPARPVTAATEQDAGIEVASTAIAEASPAQEIVPALSAAAPPNNNSQINSQVIGAAIEIDAVIDSPVETEPQQSNLLPSAIDTAVDSSPITASAVEVVELPEIVLSTTTAAAIADSAASVGVTEPVDLISFSRQQVISSIDPLASEAYAAYRQGNLDVAEGLYRQVLIDSPRHRDALLGLIAIATGKDETGVAMDLYSRLLDRDPADPVAHAGLLELMPSGSAAEQERQLKRLAERHPEVAPLAYALGNFYASARRWTDAQKAYFRALRLAKNEAVETGHVNPDYAFNLAISLEHMNQAQAARDYYQQALDFSNNYPAGFDLDVVRGRLENIGRTASR